VVLYPLDCNNFAKDAAIIPFPNEEVTPPVTKIYFAFDMTVVVVLLIKSGQKYGFKHQLQ
jgi:hypothetical protein